MHQPTSKRLVVFTGAGISADSGISTFRDKDGLWEKHNIMDVCDYTTWRGNFDLVHRFYNQRRVQLKDAHPNPAHEMLARLQRDHGASIITQNIDDLLERGGCKNVLHVHGFLTEMRCDDCGHGPWDIGYTEWKAGEQRCPSCLSARGVKPNVVFFGEAAPHYQVMYSEMATLTQDDILLVMGTSGQVVNIADIAQGIPATSILANLETEIVSEGDMFGGHIPDSVFDRAIHGRASETAAKIEELVGQLMA